MDLRRRPSPTHCRRLLSCPSAALVAQPAGSTALAGRSALPLLWSGRREKHRRCGGEWTWVKSWCSIFLFFPTQNEPIASQAKRSFQEIVDPEMLELAPMLQSAVLICAGVECDKPRPSAFAGAGGQRC